jgi:general secretion pathway protein G
MKVHRTGGFSVIELVVVIAIIVGLAGVVVPIVTQEMNDSKKANAIADINRLATALNQYIKDTLFFPTGTHGTTTLHYLYTDGTLPTRNSFTSGEGRHVGEFLCSNIHGGDRWKGPYLDSAACDPWGNAYIVNVQGFYSASERAMIISAGPDGLMETPTASLNPEGDDLMLLID